MKSTKGEEFDGGLIGETLCAIKAALAQLVD